MPRGVHDLGGLPAGPIDKTEHPPTLFEKRVDAVKSLLGHRPPPGQRLTSDIHRRAQESLSPDVYDAMPYYERWVATMRACVVELGLASEDEIARKIEDVRARGEPYA